MNRRTIFGAGAAAVLATSARAVRADTACSASSIDRAAYERYIALFNAADPRWMDFYASDITFTMKPRVFKGHAEIKAFYDQLHQNLSEHTRVLFFCSDQNGAASKIEGTFRSIKDMQDPGSSRIVRKGSTMRMQGMVQYGIRDGKFSWIDVGPAQKIQDWQPDS